jgi:hypothetical protein
MVKAASLGLAIGILIGSSASPSFAETVAPAASSAQKVPKSYNEAYRDRIERINETIRRRQIRAGCKAEAKKAYSAIHFQKRREFVRDCIARNST